MDFGCLEKDLDGCILHSTFGAQASWAAFFLMHKSEAPEVSSL